MATKAISIRKEYDSSSVIKGRVALSEKQVTNLEFGQNSARLRQDLIYVIPRQWAHNENVKVNNEDRKSLKVYAVGYTQEGQPLLVTTLSVNGLRARHYGKIEEVGGNYRVEAAKNENGLYRAVGAKQTPVFEKGSLPLKVVSDGQKKYACISRDFAFQVTGRQDCLNVGFTETAPNSGQFHINHFEENGKTYVKFDPQTLNAYQEIDAVPALDPDIVCEGFAEDYQKDLPNE